MSRALPRPNVGVGLSNQREDLCALCSITSTNTGDDIAAMVALPSRVAFQRRVEQWW